MRKILLSLLMLCLSLVFVGVAAPKGEAARKETTLTVATFNIDAKSKPNTDVQRELLAQYKVDIAGLQEIDRFTARNPLDMPSRFEKPPYKAVYFAKAIDFDGGAYGICLVSKLPFIEKSTRALDSTDAEEQRVYERVVIEKNGKKIAVYNTHLSWETEKIRNAQLVELKAALDRDPVKYKILLGDLNVDQSHKELNLFKADYHLANGKDGAWYDTFNGDDPAMKVMSVDNIITSKNIAIERVTMVEGTQSDHNLFVASLKLL